MLKQYQAMARRTVLEEVGGRHGMRKLNPARPKALEVPTFVDEHTLPLGPCKGSQEFIPHRPHASSPVCVDHLQKSQSLPPLVGSGAGGSGLKVCGLFARAPLYHA